MTGVPDEEKVINKKPDNLFSGVSVENLIKAERLPAGEWTRGMVIGKKDDGTCGLIGDTGFDETNVWAVVMENKKLDAEGFVQVYFSGEFNKVALIVSNSFDIGKLVIPARKLSIILE